jgi:hypothetical protein
MMSFKKDFFVPSIPDHTHLPTQHFITHTSTHSNRHTNICRCCFFGFFHSTALSGHWDPQKSTMFISISISKRINDPPSHFASGILVYSRSSLTNNDGFSLVKSHFDQTGKPTQPTTRVYSFMISSPRQDPTVLVLMN